MNWKDNLYSDLVYIVVAVAALVWMLSAKGAFGDYNWIPFYGIPAVWGFIVSIADI